MGISDLLERAREKGKAKKEMIKQMDNQLRAEEILQERRLSSNERELNRFMKENREEAIKVELDRVRKIRDKDIKFGHNPLNTPNITNHTDWEVLKERNMFKGKGNMFANQNFIHKGNPKLLKSKRLFGI